jgi:hypothetical protein
MVNVREVGVGLGRWVLSPVRVPMVLIVDLPVGVTHRLVQMVVLVNLGRVQPESQGHERGRANLDRITGRHPLGQAIVDGPP